MERARQGLSRELDRACDRVDLDWTVLDSCCSAGQGYIWLEMVDRAVKN